MTKFRCKRCGQFFSQKASLIYHLKNVSCNPVLSDINVKQFLEQVSKPNYYKLYIKPKVNINVSEIAERLAILEERFQDLSKRCHLHPLEIGDVKSAHRMLDSLVFKASNNYDVVYAMEVFKNTYIIENSPRESARLTFLS